MYSIIPERKQIKMQMKNKINRYSRDIHECIRDRISSFKSANWYALSFNNNITFDFVKENSDMPWVWSILSQNPNITFEFVKDNIDKAMGLV